MWVGRRSPPGMEAIGVLVFPTHLLSGRMQIGRKQGPSLGRTQTPLPHGAVLSPKHELKTAKGLFGRTMTVILLTSLHRSYQKANKLSCSFSICLSQRPPPRLIDLKRRSFAAFKVKSALQGRWNRAVNALQGRPPLHLRWFIAPIVKYTCGRPLSNFFLLGLALLTCTPGQSSNITVLFSHVILTISYFCAPFLGGHSIPESCRDVS